MSTGASTLAELRKAHGLSREQLAVQAGVSYSTIANLEAGRYTPRLDLALRLARILGVTVEAIQWEKQKQQPEHPSSDSGDSAAG
jgi:putative transcriptional regulator